MNNVKTTIYTWNLRKKLQELNDELLKITLQEIKREYIRKYNKRSK